MQSDAFSWNPSLGWYVGNDSRVFELLTTVRRIQPTKLLISDDWTHRLCVGMRPGRSALRSAMVVLCLWWKSIPFAGIACLFPLPGPYGQPSIRSILCFFPFVPMSQANGLRPFLASHDPPLPCCTPDNRHARISLPSLPFRGMSSCTAPPSDPGLRKHLFSLPFSKTPLFNISKRDHFLPESVTFGGIQIFDLLPDRPPSSSPAIRGTLYGLNSCITTY
jgi:hypothetical protein